jgi:mycothiol S-conjugate amidase
VPARPTLQLLSALRQEGYRPAQIEAMVADLAQRRGLPAPDLTIYGIDSHWLQPHGAARTLLVVYAHPDDESFGNAGTIARYSAAGVAVHYACATRGEVGTVTPDRLAGYADTAALRTAELECAAQALGLTAIHHLGHRDSGMPGSADNQHPQALVQAPPERVTGQIVALLRALRPQVVLTFPPYGGYGHPDHITVHHATRQAFSVAGDPAQYPEQVAAGLTPWSPRKLYYSTMGTASLRFGLLVLRLLRRDPRRLGTNADMDLVRMIEEATPVTTVIACGAYLAQKERAWRCHQSQLGGMSGMDRLPRPLRRRFLGTETFTRAFPPWPRGAPCEHNLFARPRP